MIGIVPVKRAKEIAFQALSEGYPAAAMFKGQIEGAVAQMYERGMILCICLDEAHRKRVQEALAKYPDAPYPLRFNIPGTEATGEDHAQAV